MSDPRSSSEATVHQTTPLDFTEYAFFKKLIELPFIDVIYVYGSRANGTSTPRSDIDLTILCPEATDEEWALVQQIVEQADILVGIDVTRWDKLPKNASFRHRILRERMPVYARRNSSHKNMMDEVFALMDWHLKTLSDSMGKSFDSPDQKNRAVAAHFFRAFRYLWRVTRRVLTVYGLRSHSPLSAFKHAYMEGWLPDRKLWEGMYRDWHNLLPDDKPEVLATLCERMPTYLAAMKSVNETLKSAIADAELQPKTQTE